MDVTACDHRHGAVVGGRYRLEEVLRCGPSRCEHRAHDELLRRTVTTLIAAPAGPEPVPDAVTLPMSARTEHGPGLAAVYDGGGDGGVLYLVVARGEGTCLADDLARGPLPVAEVRRLGVQIARILRPVHRHGYAHGALGAGLVTRGPGGVTVAGLGVEEWLDRWAHQRSDPPHPAPEQRRRRRSVSPATDVYALGRLLGSAAGRLPRSDPLRPVLRAMTRTDPTVRPTTSEVIELLEGRAGPGDDPPSGPVRALAGTLSAVALAGALALGGIAAHSAPSGLLGGATLGGATPSRAADGPPPPAGTGPDETSGGTGAAGGTRAAGGTGAAGAVAATEIRVSSAAHPSWSPVPSRATPASPTTPTARQTGTGTRANTTDDHVTAAPPTRAEHGTDPTVTRTAEPSRDRGPTPSRTSPAPTDATDPTTGRSTGAGRTTGHEAPPRTTAPSTPRMPRTSRSAPTTPAAPRVTATRAAVDVAGDAGDTADAEH